LKLTVRVDTPTPDGGTAWIERCDALKSCGYWYDAGQLPALHPSFAEHDVCAALFRTPKVEVGLAQRVKCHRCESTPELSAVKFVGITLDRCDACRGVWVDRDEYAALMNALRSHRAEGSMVLTHYRSAAPTTTMSRKPDTYTACVTCKSVVPYGEALFTSRGLMCLECGTRWAQQD